MINQRMGTKDWAMLLLLSFLWGGSFFLIGVVVAELPPLTIVTLRVGVAALTLWAVLLIGGYEIPKSFKLWRAFFMLGLLNNVIPFALIVWGQNHIGAGLASIINATTPLFTILIAGAFLADEHMSPQKVVGRCCGFIRRGSINWWRAISRYWPRHEPTNIGSARHHGRCYLLWLRLGIWQAL